MYILIANTFYIRSVWKENEHIIEGDENILRDNDDSFEY